jgi:hypothetical protein
MGSTQQKGLRAWRSGSNLPYWTVAGCAVLSILFLWPMKHPLPAASASVFAFACVQVLFPKARIVTASPLCPWNWALFVFGLKLIILPIAEVAGGVEIGLLPHLPSDLSVNLALLVDTLAFLSFVISYHFWLSKEQHSPAARRTISWYPSNGLILTYLLLGLLGVYLFFGNLQILFQYFRDPASYLLVKADQDNQSATFATAGGTFLKPFLGFAVILILCRLIDSRKARPRWLSWSYVTLLVLLASLSFAIFNYNRGSFAVPMVAVSAVLFNRARQLAWRSIISVAVVSCLLLGVATIYRASQGKTNLTSGSEDWRGTGNELDVFSVVQIYGNGPQFLGFLLEETHWGSELQLGRGLVAAVMSPVPVLGTGFRDLTGTAFYNGLMNRGTSEDQIIPFEGELFLNFHLVGIVFGFALMGLFVAKLQSAFARSRSAMAIYVIQFTTVWLLFLTVGSLSVEAQIIVYSCWPIYGFFLLRWLLRFIQFSNPSSLSQRGLYIRSAGGTTVA